jgi:hypothetical protein
VVAHAGALWALTMVAMAMAMARTAKDFIFVIDILEMTIWWVLVNEKEMLVREQDCKVGIRIKLHIALAMARYKGRHSSQETRARALSTSCCNLLCNIEIHGMIPANSIQQPQ